MHGVGWGRVGALRRILGLFGFLFLLFCKVLDSSRTEEQEPGISSMRARLGSCPLLLPVFSYLPKAGLAGWAGGSSRFWCQLLWPHPGTCLTLRGWCDHSQRQSLGKDDLRGLSLVLDSALIPGRWAFSFFNSSPNRTLPVAGGGVRLPPPYPCPVCIEPAPLLRGLQYEGTHIPYPVRAPRLREDMSPPKGASS